MENNTKPTYSHTFNGKLVEFEINEYKLNLQFSKSRNISNKIGANNANKFFINKLDPIDSNNLIFNVVYNKRITKKLFNRISKKKRINFVKRVYSYDNKNYYGSATVIILTNRNLSDEQIFIEAGGKVKDRVDNFVLIQYDNEYDASYHQKRLFQDKPNWIEYVELNLHTYDSRLPEDPVINSSDLLNPILPYQKAYEITNTFETHHYKIKGSKKIKIGVFDTGIDDEHPDLTNAKTSKFGYDFLDLDEVIIPFGYNAHGTNCAGIIAAKRNKKRGVNGIAKGCTIVDYRIGHSNNSGELKLDVFRLIKAFHKAGFEERMDVINCSWGFNTGFETLKTIINKVAKYGRKNKGLPIIFSAGNNCKPVNFPADMDTVITVGATNLKKQPKTKETSTDWGSNYGDKVDISAPGLNLVTTDIRGKYGNEKHDYYFEFGGTSAAAAQVAGCIGLMLSVNPRLTLKKIKEIIKNHAHPFTIPTKGNYGAGILNVHKSILETKKLI